MSDRRSHVRLSKTILGDLSLGSGFQEKMDAHSKELGPRHRVIDHTWERLNRLAELYGPVGYAEILIHMMADYGFIEERKE
jgi:hypothetical protein